MAFTPHSNTGPPDDKIRPPPMNTPEILKHKPVPGLHALVGPGGLTTLEVATPLCRARLTLLGAHLMSWAPHGAAEVLWMSGKSNFEVGKPLRGGVPVCFPWFGALADASQPTHGFVRHTLFDLVSADLAEGGVMTLALETHERKASHPSWAHPYKLRIEFCFGKTLEIRRTVTNTGKAPFTFTGAFHTYFSIGNIREVRLNGFDGTPFVDRLTEQHSVQKGPITFSSETDRIHLPHSGNAEIEDPVMKRRIRLSSKGSASTVVWNPWVAKAARLADFGDDEWPGVVCVETANALSDGPLVAPGARHELAVGIELGG